MSNLFKISLFQWKQGKGWKLGKVLFFLMLHNFCHTDFRPIFLYDHDISWFSNMEVESGTVRENEREWSRNDIHIMNIFQEILIEKQPGFLILHIKVNVDVI